MAKFLIFGASGGIGGAIARQLAQSGHELHLTGRNEAALGEIAAEIGGTYTAADILQEGAIEKIVAEAGDDLAGLVYAVGSINLKPLGKLTDADFSNDFKLNAASAAKAIQAAEPALKTGGGGTVLLFSTVAVAQGFAAHASVAMAKGAIEGLTRALAAELAPLVRVNAIAPSLTDTQLASAMTASDQMAKAIAGMHAIPRLGQPEDMAGLAEVLLTDKGGWITGQIIGVDGGRSSLRTRG